MRQYRQSYQGVIVSKQLLVDSFEVTAGGESQVQRLQPIPIEQNVLDQRPQLTQTDLRRRALTQNKAFAHQYCPDIEQVFQERAET